MVKLVRTALPQCKMKLNHERKEYKAFRLLGYNALQSIESQPTFQRTLLAASCWFLSWLILRPWRQRRHVPPKRLLAFSVLRGVISHKTELSLITSNPTRRIYITIVLLAMGFVPFLSVCMKVCRSPRIFLDVRFQYPVLSICVFLLPWPNSLT
jgi:hypothetical protein